MMSLKKILKWGGIILLIAYIALVIYRGLVLRAEEKTSEQVARIHATKLTRDDVLGDSLPPAPQNPDATIAGVDENRNGIRDAVELAIFAEYPNAARTRAVLLQYALVLQMQVTLPIINTETVTATVEDKSKALNCIWSITPRTDRQKFIEITDKNESFVTDRQFNTEQRQSYIKNVYENLGSYSASNASCDIDLSTLPN